VVRNNPLLARAAVLGLLRSAAGTDAGGASASWYSSLLNAFSGGGAYSGGIATTQGIQKFAMGGMVDGPIRGRDSVRALLTPGEIVLNAAQQERVASSITASAPVITNINAFDANDIYNAMTERAGQSINLNIISRNREQVRRMVR